MSWESKSYAMTELKKAFEDLRVYENWTQSIFISQ